MVRYVSQPRLWSSKARWQSFEKVTKGLPVFRICLLKLPNAPTKHVSHHFDLHFPTNPPKQNKNKKNITIIITIHMIYRFTIYHCHQICISQASRSHSFARRRTSSAQDLARCKSFKDSGPQEHMQGIPEPWHERISLGKHQVLEPKWYRKYLWHPPM